MTELVLYNLFSSKFLIISFLITIFVAGCVIYWMINQFRLKKGKIKVYGLLLEISDKDIFVLSTIIVRTFLIIYDILIYQTNLTMCFIMIGITSIIYILFNFKNILYEMVNTISIMAVIYFINVLNNYIIEIEKSTSVQIIKVSLMAFAIMYTIYNLLKGVEDVVINNINNNGGKRNEAKEEN